MTDVNSLKESIKQYETQLSQVEIALSTTPKGPDKDNLLSLQSDIQELINLTKENLESLETVENKKDENSTNDPLDREYALFKAELDGFSDESKNNDENVKTEGANDIEEELEALEGMKCRAPYGSSWGGIGYHNAMVWSVHREENESITSLNDIKVRVVFMNPTHKEMLPCPYFLEGDCKFSEEQCHFSHGEIVPLSSLQEYREPDFSNIKMGSRVLAKQKNQLWHRCVVLKVPNKSEDPYRVKFEASGKIFEVLVQDLLPLDDSDLQMSDTSSSDDDNDTPNVEYDEQEIIHSALLSVDSSQPLGNWEQHTRGIGSRIMAQMGYIIGTGLGKKADGRVQPVEATVLPAGKSLDHCMHLREMANGDKNLFSAERKMQKQKLKMEQQRQRQYEKEQKIEKSDIFNFINDTLSSKAKMENGPSCSKQSIKIREDLSKIKNISDKTLNITSFQISENIAKLEKEANKLKDSLTKHNKNSSAYNNIVQRFNSMQSEINHLRNSEKNVASEQRNRKNREKLTIF
ncbi:zinc finger CCCH-type with G patch domain-containing protein [Leptopilina boulardi]|uniref:zinc finger CCCH-type with G patch domain-containing protein n=1 Tax=Leptopilina boulardi TaxID=63433 RepID=UPI0021F664D5|nr:zinc finger CCCH-type with G patch domain-containing protein [Leptopilina boulardi]